MALVRISKSFGRKISRDWQSCEFHTSLSQDVEVASDQELRDANAALFQMAYDMTAEDVAKVQAAGLLQPNDIPPSLG